ncbi:type II CAAX prenyl endopeptidase Rce1 family protein [Lacrimispora sp. AGF001]|uniref:CPBP family glutamic-type intramembrane protease n=1 Tax=Lacrimispora sp. AGF001 TaxID=3401631 RepID=UPI003B432DB3
MTANNKVTLQIVLIYIFVLLTGFLLRNYETNIHYQWVLIFISIFEIALICYITGKVDGEPLSSIGLRSISIMDIVHGVVLGVILYLLYTVPVELFTDVSATADRPLPFSEMPYLYTLLLISFINKITDEFIFRGYIFTKLNQLLSSKWSVILISFLLIYVINQSKTLRFNGVNMYGAFITTVLYCYYLYSFSRKSIIPLIISDGLLIILRAGYGYIIWEAIFSFF